VDGELPPNVRIGAGSVITGDFAFKRFYAEGAEALIIGGRCVLDGVQFGVGRQGRLHIGDCCYFTNAVLLAELEVRIGSNVVIGWNVTIADTDFHPVEPDARVQDAIACSPGGSGRERPPIPRRPVFIDDDVWIGPNAAILKGVRVGAGAFIEPGALVTEDVPAGARVLGNPAKVVGDA